MAGKKVTVQVGFEVLTNDIAKAAKQMENIIKKSDARSQDKSRAEANVREVENYTKKINTLLQKPAMNQNDLNMLSGFEAKIRSLNDELKNIMSSVGVATTQEMKNIETQILSLNKAMEESAKDRNKRFKEQVSLRGEKASFDYSDSGEGIKSLEANLERTKDIQIQFSEELERKRIAIDENARQRQQETIAESIAEEEKQIANYEARYGKTAIAFENIEAEKLRIAAEYEKAKEKFSNPEKRAAEEIRIAERMANEEIQVLRKKFDAIDKLKPHEKAKASKDAVGDQLGVQNFTQFKKALKDEVSLRETLMAQQSKKEIQAEILKGKENYDALKRELALVEQIAAAREKTAAKQGSANIAQFRTKEESNELKDLEAQDRKNKKDIENQAKKLKIIREVAAEIAKMEGAEISEYQVQVDALTEQLEAAMAKAKESFESGKGSATGGYTEATEELDGLKESLNSNSQAMDKAMTKQKALDDSFGQIANKIKQVTGLVFLMRKAWQTLTKATDVVRGIDKEMAEIAIVTEQSMSSMWDSFDRFNKAARELNTTTRQYLEGAKIFYQQGMSTAQVTEMVAATTKAAALSGVTFAAASETLTAAIRAYHMEASQASAVTDKFAAVGAASAADFQELSTSMEKVAASAYASGIEFDSLLGILAKGVETTREAPEAIGTALKSIIARFQEMKENPLGDLEDGMSVNRVETALKTVGVALRDTSGEFRDLDDVFADLGSRWGGLSRNQRAYIATLAAGARQQSRFMAIMTDYDRTLQLARISTNSAGEANRQFAIYSNSLEAAQNKLTNSFEAFYAALLSSDLLKGLMSSFSNLINIITKLNPLVVALGLGLVIAISKTIAFVVATSSSIATLLAKDTALTKVIGKLGKYAVAQGTATAATAGTAGATMLLQGSFALLLVAVVALIAGITWLMKIEERAQKKRLEAAQLASEEAQAAKEQATNLEQQIDRYTELSRKLNKTKQEQSEYLDLIKQISSESPNLVDGIDAEGNAILKRSSALERELTLRRQIAADKSIEESDKRRAVYAEAAWNATYETGAIGERTAEQAEIIREAKDKLANELESFSAEAYGSLGKAEKYLKGEMTREEAYGAALSQFGPDQYSPETAQKFKNNLDKFFKEIDLYYETRAAETRAFYTKDLAMRGQTALDEMEILNPNAVSLATRELVGGFAKSSVDIAAAMEGFDDLTESQKIEKFADDTFKSMMEASEQLQRIPGFDKELEKLFQLKSDGATGKELIEALEAFKTNFGDFAEDRGIQESFENIYNSLSGQIINPEGIKSDVAVIGQIYKAALTEEGKKINSEKIDYMPRGDFDTSILESDLEKVLTPLSEAMQMEIMDSLDAIDETAIKAKFIDLIPEMFNIDGEYYPLVQNILENTDKDDPVAIMAAKKQIEALVREIEPTLGNTDISSIADGLVRAEIGVEDFLKKAKEAYTQIQELQKAVAESASGLDFGQAQEMMALYGANAVEQVGEVFYLTGSAIEHQRQVLMGELEKTMTGNLNLIDSEIDIAKQTIKEIGLLEDKGKADRESLEIAKEMLVVKNNEKEVYEEIYSKMQQISATELARMQNQNVLTGINAITATAGSLQGIADLYNKVNEGAMTQLDIMNAIAQNPDYLQFLEVQGNKIGFNISAIEAETKSKIESMKSTIDLRKAAIEATIAELESIAEIEESSISSDDERAKSANERGEQAVLALQGLTNAEIESFDTIANLYADESTLVNDLDKAKETAYQNEIARIRSLTEGYHQKNIAESGGIADLSKIKTETGSKVGEIDPSGLGTEKTGDWLSRFAEGLGIKTEDIGRAEQARESIGVLRAELVKLDAIGAQLNTWTPQDFLEKIVPSKEKSDSAKEDMEEIYDWFFLVFDQFYNLNRVIDQYQRKIDKIDLALEFDTTSGDKSNALTKEKTALIGKQVAATGELIKRQAESLDLARKDMSQFTDFVKFSGDEIEVRWDRINAIKVTSEEEKIWYDTLLNSIDAYVEVKDAMDESTKALMQYQAALEEVYNSLMNVVIETRQSILDAIIEKENAEISFAKEKYDKLTEMEQKYLSAIKKSISEERKLRDQARKEEDLAQKQKRLSVLQRDTSGLYSAEAVKLSQEIETDRENLRNAQVDAQLELLEKQYAVQQEQRNLEISAMEQRMDWRLENGLYWNAVDQTITNGSDAIVGLLQSTDSYMRADPLDQERMDSAFQNNATQIVDIFRSGNAIVQDVSVVDALRTGISDISNGPLLDGLGILNQTMLDSDPTVPMVNKLDEVKGEIHGLGKIFDSSVETFKANTISAIDAVSKDFASQINSLNNKLNEQQASAASGSGSAGNVSGGSYGSGTASSGSTSGSKEASLQHFLNANAGLWGGARLEADGKLGPKTKVEIDKMFGYLRNKVFSEMSGASLSQYLNPLNQAQSSKEINSLVNNLLKRFTGNGLSFGLPLKYKEGGLADYTGPAWVDGTKSKPEAFLNPDQTKLIANLRDVLEKGAMQTPMTATNSSSVSTGNINVYLANRAGASADEIGAAVQREILKSFENRASLGIRKMR